MFGSRVAKFWPSLCKRARLDGKGDPTPNRHCSDPARAKRDPGALSSDNTAALRKDSSMPAAGKGKRLSLAAGIAFRDEWRSERSTHRHGPARAGNEPPVALFDTIPVVLAIE
jgi:hypothetical protein